MPAASPDSFLNLRTRHGLTPFIRDRECVAVRLPDEDDVCVANATVLARERHQSRCARVAPEFWPTPDEGSAVLLQPRRLHLAVSRNPARFSHGEWRSSGVVDVDGASARDKRGTIREGEARPVHRRRSVYTTIAGQSAVPERIGFRPPQTAEFSIGDAQWLQHLYVDENEPAPISLNTWEAQSITAELAREELWLRNPPRKVWSFCIAYQHAGAYKPMYPDFFVVREVDGRRLVDIVDPHNPDLADAADKAKGLAIFAGDHRHLLGRIDLQARIDGQLVSLDLKDETTRNRVLTADSPAALKAVFAAP